MRLIDADALIEDLNRFFPSECVGNITPKTLFAQILTDIDNAPTIYPICEDKACKYRATERPTDEWCTDCKEYDHEKNCCPRFNKVIRETLKDAQPTGEMIPVSERLPDKDGKYLLWGCVTEDDEGYYSFVGGFDSGCEKFGDWEELYDSVTLACVDSEFFEYYEVIAWMPLPDPYKKGGETNEQ